MNEKYQVGQFGRFHFTIRSKKLNSENGFDIEGAIIKEVDPKNILLLSTDGNEFLVEKRRVDLFEPMPLPKGIFNLSISVSN